MTWVSSCNREALDFIGWFPLWFKNSWLTDFSLFGYSSYPLVINSRPPRKNGEINSSMYFLLDFDLSGLTGLELTTVANSQGLKLLTWASSCNREALDLTGWFPLWFRNSWLTDFSLFGYSSCPLVINSCPPRKNGEINSSMYFLLDFDLSGLTGLKLTTVANSQGLKLLTWASSCNREALDFTGWFPLWFKNSWLTDFSLFGYSSCPLVINPRPSRENGEINSSMYFFYWILIYRD